MRNRRPRPKHVTVPLRRVELCSRQLIEECRALAGAAEGDCALTALKFVEFAEAFVQELELAKDKV